jgi:hypothetical protein
VHLVNYYRDALSEHGPAGAPSRAIAHGWKPAVLCSATTALGLVSLCTSDLAPIRKFGTYSALGVMGMLLVLFLFLPAALQIWPLRPRRGARSPAGSADRTPSASQPGYAETFIDRMFGHLGRAIIRRHALVALACFGVIGLVGYGVTRVHTSIDLLKLFDSRSRIIDDYSWLERRLGKLVPLEVVLRFPHDEIAAPVEPSGAAPPQDAAPQRAEQSIDRLSFLERLESVKLLQQAIEGRFGPEGRNIVGRTMSAATFAPELPPPHGDTLSFARRSAFSRRLEASRAGFEQSGYLRVDQQDGAELWRISIRVAAFQNVDYGALVDELRQTVEPAVAAHRDRRRILAEIAARRGGRHAGARVLLWSRAQDDMLADALHVLLSRERLRVDLATHDPAQVSLNELQQLGELDGVLLAGGFSRAEADMIQHACGNVVYAAPIAGAAADAPAASAEARAAPRQQTEISAVYTGVVPIVYKAQRVLLDNLIESTFWSFITITPLMMFISRSVRAGIVVMLPNLLPVLVVFGGMGWMNIAVDIGSMMTASIALGVAVDDTIHFLAWFRDDLRRLGNRRQAILAAYRRCATPTLQAALISGLGLSVFAFSTFTPTQRFGWLMLTILLAGVVAELILLPALLAGPLGSVFRASGAAHASASEGPVAGNTACPPPHTAVKKTVELPSERTPPHET